jgi:hypothetical protein
MVVFTIDRDILSLVISTKRNTHTGLFVTDDRRTKCILQNVSVLCMYVCVYVYVYVCMYIYMYVCVYYVCVCIYIYVCVCM